MQPMRPWRSRLPPVPFGTGQITSGMTDYRAPLSLSGSASGPTSRLGPWRAENSSQGSSPTLVRSPGKVTSWGHALRAPRGQCLLSFLWSWSDFPLCSTRNFHSFLSLLAVDWVFCPQCHLSRGWDGSSLAMNG